MNLERVTTKTKNYPVYISYKYENKTVYYDLYHASEYDKTIFIPKKDTELFRLSSDNTKLQNITLIVCINVERNLVYFLKNYDDENSQWESKGLKLTFDRTLKDIINA